MLSTDVTIALNELMLLDAENKIVWTLGEHNYVYAERNGIPLILENMGFSVGGRQYWYTGNEKLYKEFEALARSKVFTGDPLKEFLRD